MLSRFSIKPYVRWPSLVHLITILRISPLTWGPLSSWLFHVLGMKTGHQKVFGRVAIQAFELVLSCFFTKWIPDDPECSHPTFKRVSQRKEVLSLSSGFYCLNSAGNPGTHQEARCLPNQIRERLTPVPYLQHDLF